MSSLSIWLVFFLSSSTILCSSSFDLTLNVLNKMFNKILNNPVQGEKKLEKVKFAIAFGILYFFVW